ncbi:MAG: glycine cleavage system protein GcvH [Chloroflexota bacterium]|nr:glycine cleavage system protein GcvH [Chloroflexota bacterium]
MNFPNDLKYTENDEWVRINGDIGTIGITDFAQDQLSDIVFIEYLVFEGDDIDRGEACAVVESVKAAADIFMPVSGEIVAVNENLANAPELVNSDPYGEAWMIKVKLSDPSEIDELMDAEAIENMERDH